MNAFLIMVGQGGIALGSILMGASAAHVGLHATLVGGAVLAFAVLAIGHYFSINFAPRDRVGEEPAGPPQEDLVHQDDAEAIGYYINSLSRMAGYSKCNELRDRIQSELTTINKPRP
jgi:hypothetical protein